jgi:hypothetical protein
MFAVARGAFKYLADFAKYAHLNLAFYLFLRCSAGSGAFLFLVAISRVGNRAHGFFLHHHPIRFDLHERHAMRSYKTVKGSLAILCVELLIAPIPKVLAQHQTPPTQQMPEGAPQGPPQPMLTPDQLDSLVAPIALYPDPILSQVLVASTYPLEIVEAARWLGQNSILQGQALVDAATQQPWDASVQALSDLPAVGTALEIEQWAAEPSTQTEAALRSEE